MSQTNLIPAQDLDYFLDEIRRTPNREGFDSAMKRFEDSYLHRYKSSNPVTRGKFPFGTMEMPSATVKPINLASPYSHLGSFYQPEPASIPPPAMQFQRYEEFYNIPMHERGARQEFPQTFTRTEYVPYPYPLHPPYEYSKVRPERTSSPRKNPLQESMDLRRVKEDMFNMSLYGEPGRAQTPGYTRHEENKDGFRSFYSRK